MAISLNKDKRFKPLSIAVIFVVAKAQINPMPSDHIIRAGGLACCSFLQASIDSFLCGEPLPRPSEIVDQTLANMCLAKRGIRSALRGKLEEIKRFPSSEQAIQHEALKALTCQKHVRLDWFYQQSTRAQKEHSAQAADASAK